MQSNMIENKQALSEGAESDHKDCTDEREACLAAAKEEADKINGEDGGCTCDAKLQQQNADKIKPVEVIKILGEGSQGVVALCRLKPEDAKQELKIPESPTKGDDGMDGAFVVKIFSHWQHGEEE